MADKFTRNAKTGNIDTFPKNTTNEMDMVTDGENAYIRIGQFFKKVTTDEESIETRLNDIEARLTALETPATRKKTASK